CPRRLLVAAPWDGDGRGALYKCHVGARGEPCAKADLGTAAPTGMGGSLPPAPFPSRGGARGGGVACAPLWSQPCGTSLFSTGVCARLDGDLQAVGTVAPTAQRECEAWDAGWDTQGCAGASPVPPNCAGCSTYMDIVIVLDGSNSIYPWYEVQNFLSNILSKFFIGPGQIQVGVLQYGELAVHEWDLGRFHTVEDVVAAAKNISRQEGRETRTALAIREA
ncbi:ITA10 protein, partial [Eolophus roseicapillus]|nr:ITA10 protein [Eolophus roseicapilla]